VLCGVTNELMIMTQISRYLILSQHQNKTANMCLSATTYTLESLDKSTEDK